MCGVGAGLLASAVTQPADVIKTQMQLYPSYYKGTADCVTKVIKNHGVVGLYRGMIPRCMRRTLMSAMAWTVFESLMKKLDLKWERQRNDFGSSTNFAKSFIDIERHNALLNSDYVLVEHEDDFIWFEKNY